MSLFNGEYEDMDRYIWNLASLTDVLVDYCDIKIC